MSIYKHYSFDLWMTLIKSNPVFKSERAKLFHKNFNAGKKSLEEVTAIFRQVDLMCNAINEKTGKNIDADEMNLMVIAMMNDFSAAFADVDLDELYTDTEKLLFNYMPMVYSDETITALNSLKQNNTSFNIASNTAFIKGCSLKRVLAHLELESFFDFQLYSDEIGVSKPNKEFFELVLNQVNNIYLKNQISLKDIVHIGDNPKADIEGAQSVGINSILINSNSTTILSLLN